MPHPSRTAGSWAKLTESGLAPAPGEVSWNFEKFIVDRNGSIVARYGPDTTPEDEVIAGVIRGLLAA